MGIRQRKQNLILALKGKALGVKMPAEQVQQFELMYARARSEPEQNEVTKVLDDFLFGWKTGTSAWDKLRQNSRADDDDEEEEDSPALARSRVSYLR